MHSSLDATYMSKEEVTSRLLHHAAQLWGLDHPDQVDPIVQLLVDVLGYELSRLGNEMATSDGKLLEQIAHILVPGTHCMASPAHALMVADPLEPRTTINGRQHFYVPIKEKLPTGEEAVTDLFFSPLQDVDLVKGRIACRLVQDSLFAGGESEQVLFSSPIGRQKPGFHGLWLGLDMDPGIATLDSLQIHLRLPEAFHHLEPLLAMVQWECVDGESLEAAPYTLQGFVAAEGFDGEQFALLHPERDILERIAAAYRHRLLRLGPQPERSVDITRQHYPAPFETQFDAVQLATLEKPLWWLKLEFPPAIPASAIKEIKLAINSFPVVAKRMHTVQQRLQPGRNIVPLRQHREADLFYVDQVRDDIGRPFRKRKIDTPEAKGTYHLHQGDLERLDKTTAAGYLAKMLRLVQEESSIFIAYGQDLMLKQMSNLRNDLEAIRNQLERVAHAPIVERQYLVVEPLEDAKSIEVDYWTAERRPARHVLPAGTTLLPYKQVSVAPGSARLKSPMNFGNPAPAPEDRMAALRYGLLTRQRIVSRQDLRQHVLFALAGLVEDVTVTDGVAVSSHPKQGLVRTVDVWVQPTPTAGLTAAEWTQLLAGVQVELNAKSVHTAEYRLQLMGTGKGAHTN